jgi:LPXTG-motif cell wall-anchored protein
MSVFKQMLPGVCVLALLAMFAPGARASESDQKVVTTFNAPVEIPGQVLPPGTYVFKILDIWSTRDVVRVFNADESKVLATTIAIPRYRTNPTDKAVFVFEERGSNSPQALEAWYYPGYTYGHQFIYAARITPEAVKANSAVTPAPSNESTANQPNAPEELSPALSAGANKSEPTAEDLTQSTQSTEKTQTTQSQTTPNTSTTTSGTSTDQVDKELPKTSSTTPLIALIGILLLGGALGLKTLASRVS